MQSSINSILSLTVSSLCSAMEHSSAALLSPSSHCSCASLASRSATAAATLCSSLTRLSRWVTASFSMIASLRLWASLQGEKKLRHHICTCVVSVNHRPAHCSARDSPLKFSLSVLPQLFDFFFGIEIKFSLLLLRLLSLRLGRPPEVSVG